MFVEIVLKLIAAKGITKNKLLTEIGIGTNAFVNWSERGTIPSGDVVLKIANYFNVTTDYLLTGKEAEQPTPTTITKEDQEILTMYNALSERKKGEIYGTLKTLSSLHDDNITKRELEFTNDLANLAKEDVNVFSVHKNQV